MNNLHIGILRKVGATVALLASLAVSSSAWAVGEFAWQIDINDDKIKVKLELEGIDPSLTYDVTLSIRDFRTNQVAFESVWVNLDAPKVKEKSPERSFEVKFDEDGDLELKAEYKTDGTRAFAVTIIVNDGANDIVSHSQTLWQPICPPDCGGTGL